MISALDCITFSGADNETFDTSRKGLDVAFEHGGLMARPRSEEARRSALDAAIATVVEHGVRNFSVNEVARRSGVAKTTIYRNWDTSQDLLFDALNEVLVPEPEPDTGSFAGDIKAAAEHMLTMDDEVRSFHRRMFADLLAASTGSVRGNQFFQRLVDYRMAPMRATLERAQERGEIRCEIDLTVASELLMGPMLSRIFVQGATYSKPEFEALVELTMRAVGVEDVAS